jgi:hypothetical protein
LPPPPTATPTIATGKPEIFIILPPGDIHQQDDTLQVVIAIQDPDGVGNVSWWVTDAETAEVILRDSYWCNNRIECVLTQAVSNLPAGTFNIFVAAFDRQENSVLEEAQISIR